MKIGIIGAGSMGHAHAPSWQYLKDQGAELVGVLTSRPESAQAFANTYNLQAFSSLDELIDAVDIVDICTPTHLHKDLTLRAAQAGKHVICEKPIALNVDDANVMIDACEEAGVRLFIAHVLRFITPYDSTKQSVDAGHIGKPCVIRLTRAGYQPRKSTDNWFVDIQRSGGMMLDLMIHDYDYARWLAGDVKRVFAKSAYGEKTRDDGDYALVTLRHTDGTISHIEGGWVYPPGFFRTAIDIAGTEGVIEWKSDNVGTLQTHLANPLDVEVDEVAVPSAKAADSPFTTQLGHFYECIKNGAEPIVTTEDARSALEIALAAIESAQTGLPVTLKETE